MQKFAAAMSMAEKPGLWLKMIKNQERLVSCLKRKVVLLYIHKNK